MSPTPIDSHPQLQDSPQLYRSTLMCWVDQQLSCWQAAESKLIPQGTASSFSSLAPPPKSGYKRSTSKSQAAYAHALKTRVYNKPKQNTRIALTPRGNWGPGASARPRDQVTAGRPRQLDRGQQVAAGGQGGWGVCVRHRKGLGARHRPGEGGSLGKCLSPPSAQRETASPCGEGQDRDILRGSRCVVCRRCRLRWTPAVP